MEDLDTPRVVPGSADQILRSLEVLGLTWDEDPVLQSRRTELYEESLWQLSAEGLVYGCGCSRAELRRAASAPSSNPADLDLSVYPGTCRNGIRDGREPRSLRFRVPEETVRFTDLVRGAMEQDLVTQCGDFVVRRADGPFAYQLAVVVDDADQGVTQVVRGGDLLSSTARQIALQRALRVPTPSYAHLPLILGADGAKLGKRTGAIPVLDGNRHDAAIILGRALEILGCDALEPDTPDAMLKQALTSFDPEKVPRGSVEVT